MQGMLYIDIGLLHTSSLPIYIYISKHFHKRKKKNETFCESTEKLFVWQKQRRICVHVLYRNLILITSDDRNVNEKRKITIIY